MDASAPAWGYFEHDADVGVVGRGARPEDALVGAARATFALMSDPAGLRAASGIEVEFEEPDLEIALVRWLNLLLAHAHDRGLALCDFALRRDGARWSGSARGEPWREGLERGTDVKGATLTALAVRETAPGQWEARCIVDV